MMLLIVSAILSIYLHSRPSGEVSIPVSLSNVESLTQQECPGQMNRPLSMPSRPGLWSGGSCAFMCAAAVNGGSPTDYYQAYFDDTLCTSTPPNPNFGDYENWWGTKCFPPFSSVSTCCELIQGDVGAVSLVDMGTEYHMMLVYNVAPVGNGEFLAMIFDPYTPGLIWSEYYEYQLPSAVSHRAFQ